MQISCIKKNCVWIVKAFLKPTLAFLFLSILINPINEKLLRPFWSFLNIQNGYDLTFFTALLVIIIVIFAWRHYKCKYNPIHYGFYFLALGIYVLFSDKWNYIKAFGNIDCWSLILIAYPFGFAIHWLLHFIQKGIKHFHQSNTTESTKKWSVPSMVFLEDNPIQDSSEDEFRFDVFAQRIAKTVIENKSNDSYSLGITGSWGSGKTSMLNCIKKYLESEESIIVVEFNPRESAETKYIQTDFLSVISLKLNKYHLGAKQVMTKYMKYLRVIAADTLWAKILNVVLLSNNKVTKESVEDIISQIDKKIVVLIDDFDRLTGEEILEVLKVIDKNGSFQNTFFISAYDKEYVNSVLRSYLGDNSTIDFSDKYFNLELRLPDRKQHHKNRYLLSRMHKFVSDGTLKNVTKQDVDNALSAIIGHIDNYLPTIRDLKRFIGLTMATYLEVQDDVVLKDYLLLSLIKYKYPKEYEGLYKQEYFTINPFSHYDTNFVFNKQLSNLYSFSVLSQLFPDTKNNTIDDKNFGYKHLSWKRSFDYYFFDYELGHIPNKYLIPLTDPSITLDDFRNRTQNWTTDVLKQDLAEFVISRSEKIHSEEDFNNYLRLLAMACYFCPYYQLHFECIRLLAKKNIDDNTKKFNILEDKYSDIILQFIGKTDEWVLPATMIQNALHSCLKPGVEVDLIIDSSRLQAVAKKSLHNVLLSFQGKKANSEDVYEMLKANIVEVVEDGHTLSQDAIDIVRKSMVTYAKMYFKDIVWHKPIQESKTGITIGFHNSLPLQSIFKTEADFVNYLNEVGKRDESLMPATNCLLKIYTRVSLKQYNPITIYTKGLNYNISQGDFEQYNLVFECER